jgi:hypothetical protein
VPPGAPPTEAADTTASPSSGASAPGPFARISIANAEVCGLDDRGDVWCWASVHPWGLPLGATQIVAVPAAPHADWLEGGDPHALEAMTCTLLGSGHVACWRNDMPPALIPGLGGITELRAGTQAVCAVTSNGAAACFDSRLRTHWVYDRSQVDEISASRCSATAGDMARCFDVDDAPTSLPLERAIAASEGVKRRCSLSGEGRISCEDWNEVGKGFDPAFELDWKLARPWVQEVPLMSFHPTSDKLAPWSGLSKGDFPAQLERLSPTERVELARVVLPRERLGCVAMEDANSMHLWPEVGPDASLYDPCWRREVVPWAIEQLPDAELGSRAVELSKSLEYYDYQSHAALAGSAGRLRARVRLELVARLVGVHHDLAAEVTSTLEDDQLDDALALGVPEALEWMNPETHASTLVSAAKDKELEAAFRIEALSNFNDPFDRSLFESLADDSNCQVSMYASAELFAHGGPDLRPRIKDAGAGVHRPVRAICRLSWDPDYAEAQYEALAAGSHAKYLEGSESEAFDWLSMIEEGRTPDGVSPLRAHHFPQDVQDYWCEGFGDDGEVCGFDTSAPYETNPESPEFELETALSGTRVELVIQADGRGYRVRYLIKVHIDDCTNC